MPTIYKITSPSGKSYIGQTISSFKKRWSQHKGSVKSGHGSPLLINAIKNMEQKIFILKF
jgi:hypothetical protein